MSPRDTDFTEEPTAFDRDDGGEEHTNPGHLAVPASGIEVELVMSEGVDPHPFHANELHSANTIYALDAGGHCLTVWSRGSSAPDLGSQFVGARLAGGQRRQGGELSIAYPYPLVGMEAVFELGEGTGRYAATTPVERVVLRVRTRTLELPAPERPDWMKITRPMWGPPTVKQG